MSLLQDLRYAIRLLVKDKWLTAVAVIALALGIGVNATVFTFVNAVLWRCSCSSRSPPASCPRGGRRGWIRSTRCDTNDASGYRAAAAGLTYPAGNT